MPYRVSKSETSPGSTCGFRLTNTHLMKHFCLGLLGFGLMLPGCTNLQEKRVISAFQEGLEEGNLELLREKSSNRFEHHALRHPESNDSLEQVRIPDGEYEVLSVEEVSETEKKVTVGFGKENRRKIQYQLVKNVDSNRWEVDDILLRQRTGGKTITMPVSEQMDVLLSSREFYEAWSGTNREQAIAYCDPTLSEALSKLPPRVLAGLVSQVIGKADQIRTFRPEVYMSGDDAFVKLNRPHGKLQITMEKSNSRWQVKDLSLESRDENVTVSSLLATAILSDKAIAFLDAWKSNNKEALEPLTEKQLYQASLVPGRLTDLTLPDSMSIESGIDVQVFDSRADIIVNDPERTVRISFNGVPDESPESYLVADVKIYDMKQDQTISMAAALTARPVAQIFLDAVKDRNTKMLQYSSTRDLHEKTWSRGSRQTLAVVPLGQFDLNNAQIEHAEFLGDVTHVHVKTPSQMFTVVLHEQNGKALVDDVMINSKVDNPEQVLSMKDYLGTMIPVYELASNIHHNRPVGTLRLVSDDFYDRVFSVSKTMPQAAFKYLDYVTSGQATVSHSNDQTAAIIESDMKPAAVKLNREEDNARESYVIFETQQGSMLVTLHEEEGLLRVDDALITLPHSTVAKRLKQEMRMEIAGVQRNNGLQLASGTMEAPAEVTTQPRQAPQAAPQKSEVVTAFFQEASDSHQEPKIMSTAHEVQQTIPGMHCPDCEGVTTPNKLQPAPEMLLLQPIPTE